MDRKKAVIYCSANSDIDPRYNQAARDVVRAACLYGYDIVSGGTVKGTMKVVCDEAAANGASAIGILPEFMAHLAHPLLTERKITSTMSERKELMREGVSLAVALPGGIGTLDELFETLVLVKLGQLDARVVAFDVDGFWKPLTDLLDYLVSEGMLAPKDREILKVVDTVDELKTLL